MSAEASWKIFHVTKSCSSPGPSPAGGQWCPTPPFKICAPHFTFGPLVATYIQCSIFKMCSPFWFVAPPAAISWRRAYCSPHIFIASFPNATCQSRQWCHITRIELPNYVVTITRFHWGRDIGCLPSPPYYWSCMPDQLLMWHNATYSVYHAQRQVSASLWNARAYGRRSTYIKSVYKHYTVTDIKVTELTKVIARQALTTVATSPGCCVERVIHHERDVREEQHHTCMWREQIIIELSWHVNSIVACCHSAKLCAYAARDFLSQQNGAVTRMWRLCGVQPSHKESAIGAVRCKNEGMLLQPLRWCCVECANVQPSHKESAIGAVRCKNEGMLLQPLRWCCVECAIHRERDVREEQHHTYMWRE